VLRALAEAQVDPAGAVLSAPMLGLHPTWLPTALLRLIGRVMVTLGDPRRPAWDAGEHPGAAADLRARLLTHDAARYADEVWWRAARPELVMGGGSWGWIERAAASIAGLAQRGVLERITTPVLLLATRADRLVSWPAIRAAAARLPHAELVAFGDEAGHELLREADPVRDRVLAAIDGFLARVAEQGAEG
ncbi:MAG: alpha/beta hydrolase, partial [Proteobacteria bacterium]|nr:alpha/beta hydrolase [Pseudomonadota bacterium]